jgi:hypothetical protein
MNKSRYNVAVGVAALLVSSCGASQKQPAQNSEAEATETEAPAAKAASEQSAASEPVKGIPEACARESEQGFCLPEDRFVKTLCDDVHQDVALWMFREGTPWTRAYLTRKTEAWNASGGASIQGELAFDEEVLILRERLSKSGGIQVSGAMGSYDALRWNGSCVSLMAEEITKQKPPKLLHSRVEWRSMSEPMQEALRSNEQIVETYRARRSECKGATMGEVSKKCEQLDDKLVALIVKHVREGGQLAEPKFP